MCKIPTASSNKKKIILLTLADNSADNSAPAKARFKLSRWFGKRHKTDAFTKLGNLLSELHVPHKQCLKIKTNQSAALNGTTYCITILTGIQHFTKLKKIHEVKQKKIQIRSFHRILATNVTLKRMKVTNDERCTFSNAHNENTPHLFWRCDIIQHFWSV